MIEGRNENPINITLIRENMEGEYGGLEHSPVDGVVESLKVVTRKETERIIQFAFDYARRNGRNRVTCVHKANIMKLTDGLFLSIFRELAERNGAVYSSKQNSPGDAVQASEMIVDNASMQLVSNPSQFDVIVTSNLYGNILANIGAGLVGGAGLIPGYNIGYEHVIFEPGARQIAHAEGGRNSTGPVSMLLSATLMLRHIGLYDHAEQIYRAVLSVLGSHQVS